MNKTYISKKEVVRSILLPAVVVPVAGLFVLALCYALYLGFYLTVESTMFAKNPSMMPTGLVRIVFTLILLVLGLLLLFTKWPDLLKVILLTGPMTMLIITSVMINYLQLPIAVAAVSVIVLASLFLVYFFKKPWFYYLGIAISVVAGIFYAWPR
ncbi:MAG: hypothetical protein ACYCYM_14575 [Saccharofermentanales bacterium]